MVTDPEATTLPTRDLQESPWPLRDIVRTLVDAFDHLNYVHDCDCRGYERRLAARDMALKFLAGAYTDKSLTAAAEQGKVLSTPAATVPKGWAMVQLDALASQITPDGARGALNILTLACKGSTFYEGHPLVPVFALLEAIADNAMPKMSIPTEPTGAEK